MCKSGYAHPSLPWRKQIMAIDLKPNVVIEQPSIPSGSVKGTYIPKYVGAAGRAARRLKNLEYDPIARLVHQYSVLQEELKYQENLRSGKIVELNATGKPRAFRAEILLSIHDKLITIAEKLLRYGYGRIPELNVLESRAPKPLMINLTREGETYVINDKDEFDTIDQDDGEF